MSCDYILLKFISCEQYVKDFLDGSLYMNSLYYFWNEYPLEMAMKKKEKVLIDHPEYNPEDVLIPMEGDAPLGQMDLLEGTISTVNGASMNFENSFSDCLMADMFIRAVGYKYCNILSFYRLDLNISSIANHCAIQYSLADAMNKFGENVAIIKNTPEFLKRINNAVTKTNYKYLCGNVQYKSLTKNGHVVKPGPNITLKREDEIDIDSEPFKSALASKRNCFVKVDQYKYQNEWRLALYRGIPSKKAFRLEVGDIRDIVHVVNISEIEKTLDADLKNGIIKPNSSSFYGNIARKDMKNLFYQLGNNKGELIGILG